MNIRSIRNAKKTIFTAHAYKREVQASAANIVGSR
jgi:hypothetical protein